MQIVYNDGGVLDVSEIEIIGDTIIGDGIYSIPVDDIDRITD